MFYRPPVTIADVCHITESWSDDSSAYSAECICPPGPSNLPLFFEYYTHIFSGAGSRNGTVHIYTNAPSAELFLNGKSVGNT